MDLGSVQDQSLHREIPQHPGTVFKAGQGRAELVNPAARFRCAALETTDGRRIVDRIGCQQRAFSARGVGQVGGDLQKSVELNGAAGFGVKH